MEKKKKTCILQDSLLPSKLINGGAAEQTQPIPDEEPTDTTPPWHHTLLEERNVSVTWKCQKRIRAGCHEQDRGPGVRGDGCSQPHQTLGAGLQLRQGRKAIMCLPGLQYVLPYDALLVS